MNTLKSFVIVCCLIFACGVVPAARASEWDQQTKLFFSQPIEIPGCVLLPGTYWFVLSNNEDREVVRVYSEDWSTLYATEQTVPTFRTDSTHQTEVEFATGARNAPEALVKWYYPSRHTGHEFVYPKREETALKHETTHNVLTGPVTSSIPGSSGS